MTQEIPILIVGGGPVGLTLAADLGWRGVPCLLVEQSDGVPRNPRCNAVAARSMEHFRRLGLADRIRQAGLPREYPTTARYQTRFIGGYHLLSLPGPSWGDVTRGVCREDASWPTPEPQHRLSQLFLDPILRDHVAGIACVQTEYETRLTRLQEHEGGVSAELVSSKTGEAYKVDAAFVIGCDGAHSTVRKAVGVQLRGNHELARYFSVFFRSQELGRLNTDPAWSVHIFNHETTSSLLAIDGCELWLNHHKFPPGHDTSSLQAGEMIAKAVGRAIEFQPLSIIHWTPKRLVADTFRRGRVLLAGDAAHLWIPMAGFGMNAGIQEATTLAWMLSAIYYGWAGSDLLEAYDLERRPIGEQVADAVANVTTYALRASSRIEDPGPEGERARGELAKQLREHDRGQFEPVGLNFAAHFGDSPLVEPDGTPAPLPLSIDKYEPSARPGCRLPHFWRRDGTSVFDHLGPDFTLIRAGRDPLSDKSICAAAAKRRIPLRVVDLPESLATKLYGAKLMLVRPDQHVAWRGDHVPEDPGRLLERVTGHRTS
jgi:2-polyprenyl-6-methoxyphenol hydroxylase-like FAD-dependent oxidoreductase